MRRQLLVIVGVVGVVSTLVADTVQVLDLEQARRIALRQNAQIVAARLEVEKAEQQVREALGTALPGLSVSGRYTWNVERPVFFFPDFRTGQIRPITVGSEHAFQTNIQLTQTLFNATAFTAVQNSHLYAQAARQRYQQTVNEVFARITQAFYQALLAQEAHQVFEQSYRRAQEFARQVSILYDEGFVAEYDKLRATVSVSALRAQWQRAKQRAEDAQQQLKILLGLPLEISIQLDGQLTLDTTDGELDEEEIIRQVLQGNYGLMAMRTQGEIADKVVDFYQAEFLPMVFLFGNYTYQGQSDVFRLSDFQTAKSAAVGLQLSWSLFNGWQSSARVQQAKIDYQKVQTAIEEYQRALIVQTQSLIQRYRIARQEVEAYWQMVQTAERGYRVAQTRYREGVGSYLEVSDAETSLRQLRLEYLQRVYEVLNLKTQIQALKGELSAGVLPD